MRDITEFENIIDYHFINKELLITALTHSSFANENKGTSYERLEFLGDSILGFVTTEYLFENFPHLPEGQLTKNRAALVCEKSLCSFSKKLSVNEFVKLSNGELKSGGNLRSSILGDIFESITAAIFVDSGSLDEAEKFVLKSIVPATKSSRGGFFTDYKTTLQEIIQQNPEEHLSYIIISETGPDHDKRFVVDVCLNTNVVARGNGKSKKEAEQNAAREALELMGY